MKHIYRTAIIGCGHRGRLHAEGFKVDERCNVVALVDIKREAAEEINKDFEFDAVIYEDYREMLEKEKPDIVAICLWTKLHFPVFKDCAEAGVKVILCEKPMAHTWSESLEYARIVEKTGCQLTFGHQRRFSAGNRLARQLIEEGRFGKILRMDLYSPRHLLDCGTHTFDQALSFNGECPVKWVLGAVDVDEVINYFDVQAEGMAVGTLVFENGVRANIQVGGPDMDMWSGVRVIGTDGFLEVFWDGDFGKAVVYSDPSWQPPLLEKEPQVEFMRRLVRNAVDSFEKGVEPELSYKKALRAAEIIFAFYESVRRNRRVELPLTDVTDNPFITMLENGEFPEYNKAK